MGQYWKIVNVDKLEELPNNDGFKFGDVIGGCGPERLVDLLQVPRIPEFRVSAESASTAKERNNASPLVGLPLEILDEISAHVGDADVPALGLTCAYLFRVLGPRIRKTIIADQAPWAGDRLIMIGDYTESVPDTCAEFREDAHLWASGMEQKYAKSTRENPIYHLARERDMAPSPTINDSLDARFGDDKHLFARLVEGMKSARASAGAAAAQPILCVHDTKEYVLDSAIAESEFAYSLGEVICCSTPWTNDLGATERIGGVGKWAGCRFSIATLADIGDDWTDASAMAIGLLERSMQSTKADGKRA